jgi:hypothetical protein
MITKCVKFVIQVWLKMDWLSHTSHIRWWPNKRLNFFDAAKPGWLGDVYPPSSVVQWIFHSQSMTLSLSVICNSFFGFLQRIVPFLDENQLNNNIITEFLMRMRVVQDRVDIYNWDHLSSITVFSQCKESDGWSALTTIAETCNGMHLQ